MKVYVFLTAAALFGLSAQVNAQQADSTGMPGDNLDLYAVMDQFKKSENLQSFEKSINDPKNKINNLDLNKDGKTDYIKVIDHADSNAHAIVLQVPVNAKESQDVAVIEVEKQGNENAKIQIVGDKEVYGENYVVEPYEKYVGKEEYDAQQRSGTYNDGDDVYDPDYNEGYDDGYNDGYYDNTQVVYVNVWSWPCVSYIYSPYYDPWYSPWYWGYYPGWWRPWRPYHWHVYHGHVWHYHGPGYYYRTAPVHHMRAAHSVYQHRRTASASYRRANPVIKSRSYTNPRMRERDNKLVPDRSRQQVSPNRHDRQQVRPSERPRQNVKPNRQQRERTQPRVRPNRQRQGSSPMPRHQGGGGGRQRSGGGGNRPR